MTGLFTLYLRLRNLSGDRRAPGPCAESQIDNNDLLAAAIACLIKANDHRQYMHKGVFHLNQRPPDAASLKGCR